jgi:hypothetical protein
MTPAPPPRPTPIALVLCAWVVIVLPLGWGLYQSVVKSLPLFTTEAPAPGR